MGEDRLVAPFILQSEVECQCADPGCPGKDPELIACPSVQKVIRMAGELFEHYHELHDTAPKVSSFVRCEKHNHSVGGRPRSAHLDGVAIDVIPPNGDIMDFVLLAEMQGWPGIIWNRHRGFVHIDRHGSGRVVRGFVDGTGRYWTDGLGNVADSEVLDA